MKKISQCSSRVEHRSCKAGVVGANPTTGSLVKNILFENINLKIQFFAFNLEL